MARRTGWSTGPLCRRDLLRAVTAGVVGGVAGCTAVRERLCEDDRAPAAVCESGGTLDVGDGTLPDDLSVLDDAVLAHEEYRDEMVPVLAPIEFEYGRIEAREERDGETAAVVAESAAESTGDRVLIQPPDSADIGAVAAGFVAFWNAPIDEELASESIYGETVRFYGGTGADIAVAAGSGIFDGSAAVFAVRGESRETLATLVDGYEDGFDPVG